MQRNEDVAIFWDYDSCKPATITSGYEIVDNIRCVAHVFGSVKAFKAYLPLADQACPPGLRMELQSSGVSLTDCPHYDNNDASSKTMIVDLITHAIDHPAPSTIVLISGNQEFAYAVAILRLRRYRVVIISPPEAHMSLKSQGSVSLDWNVDVMGMSAADDAQPPPPPRMNTNGRRDSDSMHAPSTSSRATETPKRGRGYTALSSTTGTTHYIQGEHEHDVNSVYANVREFPTHERRSSSYFTTRKTNSEHATTRGSSITRHDVGAASPKSSLKSQDALPPTGFATPRSAPAPPPANSYSENKYPAPAEALVAAAPTPNVTPGPMRDRRNSQTTSVREPLPFIEPELIIPLAPAPPSTPPVVPIVRPSTPAAPTIRPSTPAAPTTRPSTPTASIIRPSTPAAPIIRPSTPAAPIIRPSTPGVSVIRPNTPTIQPHPTGSFPRPVPDAISQPLSELIPEISPPLDHIQESSTIPANQGSSKSAAGKPVAQEPVVPPASSAASASAVGAPFNTTPPAPPALAPSKLPVVQEPVALAAPSAATPALVVEAPPNATPPAPSAFAPPKLLTATGTPPAAQFTFGRPRSATMPPAGAAPTPTPKSVPTRFKPLVATLERLRAGGTPGARFSQLGPYLKGEYKAAGVSKLSKYLALAAQEDIVTISGAGELAFIALRAEWYGAK